MFDEVLVNILEGALELLLGGHHLPGVRQQEAGHLTETGTQVCPNKLSCVDIGQKEAGHLTETGTQVSPNK
jgi:hypothetical protein